MFPSLTLLSAMNVAVSATNTAIRLFNRESRAFSIASEIFSSMSPMPHRSAVAGRCASARRCGAACLTQHTRWRPLAAACARPGALYSVVRGCGQSLRHWNEQMLPSISTFHTTKLISSIILSTCLLRVLAFSSLALSMIPNPHDLLFKAVFGQAEHARGELCTTAPLSVAEALDWS